MEAGRSVPGRRPAVRLALPVGLAPTLFPQTTGCFSIQLREQTLKIKRAGSAAAPGPSYSTKICHLLGPSRHPTRGFTAVVSVFGPSTSRLRALLRADPELEPRAIGVRSKGFGGTPPTKPSFFRNLVEPTGECVGRARRHRAAGGPWPALAQIALALANILKVSGGSCSFVTRFRCRYCWHRPLPADASHTSHVTNPKTKNPATVREAGLKETRFLVLTCLPRFHPDFPGYFPLTWGRTRGGRSGGGTSGREQPTPDASLARLASSAKSR